MSQLNTQHFLRAASNLKHGAIMRTRTGRTVADCRFCYLKDAFRIGNCPRRVFFCDSFIELRKNFRFQSQKTLVVKASHVNFDFAVSGDGINSRPTFNRSNRPGCLRISSRTQISKLFNSTSHGVNSARRLSIFSEAVAAQAVNAHAPAMRTRSSVEHTTHISGVHRDKAVNLIVFDQMFRTADVTVAFFTNSTHEPNITFCLDVGFFKAS